jgi:hypothetical protein
MFEELAVETGAGFWTIVSMFFFLAAWLGIAIWVYQTRPEEFDSRARLALEGDAEEWQRVPPGSPAER